MQSDDPNKMSPQDAAAMDGKVFSLKNAEVEMIRYITTHHNAIMAFVTSFIAAERLGYPITPNTQFIMMDNFTKVKIVERSPEATNQALQDEGGSIVRAAE